MTTTSVDKQSAIERRLLQTNILKVNHDYQRGLVDPKVFLLAQKWDAALCQDLDVAPLENGSFEVLDGQTRLAAMRKLGIVSCWCRIHWDVATSQQRSAVFVGLNQMRWSIRAIDQYRALLHARVGLAVQVETILHRHGLRIAKASAPRGIPAVRSLFQIHGWGVLDEVFSVMENSWDFAKPCLTQYMLLGLGAFCKAYPEHSESTLTRQIRGVEPSVLLRESEALVGSVGHKAEAVMLTIRRYYNKRLRTATLMGDRPFPRFRVEADPLRLHLGSDGPATHILGPKGIPIGNVKG